MVWAGGEGMATPRFRHQRRSSLARNTAVLATSILAVVAAGAGWTRYAQHRAPAASAEGDLTFGPTVPNPEAPPGPAPEGMVWIPGGEFSMGAQAPAQAGEVAMNATRDSRPVHRVY